MMKKLLTILLLMPFLLSAQVDTLTVEPDRIEQIKTTSTGPQQHQVFIEPNYVYEQGIAYDETGESLSIKEAFTTIRIIEGTMHLTVFYNPSSLFKKKAVEEYEIATAFYYTDDGAVTAKGNRLTVEYDDQGQPHIKQESYKFVFFLQENQLVIESLVDSQIKFILTGQQLPSAETLEDLMQETQKVQSKG